MDDVDLAAADDVVAVVVARAGVRPQPPEAEQDLPRRERLVIDLPDREVGVASTRSSTAGAHHAGIDPEQRCGDDEDRTDLELHVASVTDRHGGVSGWLRIGVGASAAGVTPAAPMPSGQGAGARPWISGSQVATVADGPTATMVHAPWRQAST